MLFPSISFATEHRQPLVIADDKAYPPFAFLDAKGTPRGITIDIWKLWSRKTGIPVRFELMEWDAALKAVRDGRADAVGGLFRTPEREADFAFSHAILKIPTGIFFHRQIAGIKGLEDLAGFRVGAIKGDSAEELLRIKHPQIDMETYPGVDELVRAAIAGEIKVLVADEPVVLFYLAQHREGDQLRQASEVVAVNRQCTAVRQGNEALLATIQSGFDKISEAGIQHIVSEWGGRSAIGNIPWREIGLLLLAALLLVAAVLLWNFLLHRQFAGATESLREREETFRALAENSQDIIMRFDRQGRHLYVNPAVEKHTGIPAPDFIGKTHAELGFPDHLYRIWDEAIQKTIARKAVERVEFQLPSGAWIDWLLMPEFDQHGEVKAVITSAREITERKRIEKALQESEALFRNLFQQHTAVKLIIDPTTGQILDANPAAERYYGWTRTQLQQMKVQEINTLPPEEVAAEIAKAATQQKGFFEFRHRLADGSIRDVNVFSSTIETQGKKLLHSIIHDITEQKRVEEALHISEQRLASFMDSASDSFLIMDADFRIVEINRTALRYMKKSKEEVLGKSMLDFAPDIVSSGRLEKHRDVLRTGNPRIIDRFIPHPIYGDLFMQVKVFKVGDGLGVIAVDITERKRAEEALRDSEEKFRTLGASALDAVIMINGQGIVEYWNPAATAMFGYTAEEVLNLDIHDLIMPEVFRKTYVEGFEHFKKTGGGNAVGKVLELHAKRKDQTEFPIEIALSSIEVKGKHWATAVVRDITERKRAEEERAKLEAQLLQAMKMEAVGRLAGGVAHDFNNLLTSIGGNVQLALLDLSPNDPLTATMKEIGEASKSAASLTQQLLAFSRKQLIEPKVLDLNELIAKLQKMLARLIGEDIEFHAIPSTEPSIVRIDPGQFEQILVNLAINARDAMPEGGKLIIATANVELDEDYCRQHAQAKYGPHVLLTIGDTGQGMNDEVKRHLFEPFYTTKPVGRGTGLGLATIYGAVMQAGGSIEVYSEEGSGTVFKIYLPRVDREAGRIEEHPSPVEMPSGNETVLLVEDDDLVRGLAIKVLQRLGYRVLFAPDGQQALSTAEQHPEKIDLLLTDVIMPGMNGRQLAERLVQLHPETKVLFTSGYTEDAIAHHGVIDDGLLFIGKPYTPQALAMKLREVLDKN